MCRFHHWKKNPPKAPAGGGCRGREAASRSPIRLPPEHGNRGRRGHANPPLPLSLVSQHGGGAWGERSQSDKPVSVSGKYWKSRRDAAGRPSPGILGEGSRHPVHKGCPGEALACSCAGLRASGPAEHLLSRQPRMLAAAGLEPACLVGPAPTEGGGAGSLVRFRADTGSAGL